jgi:O-antigen/teichoic acid export membrane protein
MAAELVVADVGTRAGDEADGGGRRRAARPRHARPNAVQRVLREPLLQGVSSLLVGHGVTTALGVVAWLLAARLLPADTLGRNVVVLAVVVVISEVAQLGLTRSLPRYLPVAGRAGPRLVRVAYAAAIPAALVATAVLVASGVPARLLDGANVWVVAAAVVGGGVAWTAFALQDAVLLGARRATWVPVENAVYAALRIAAVVVFAAVAEPAAVLLAWAVPAAVIVAVVAPSAWAAVRRLEQESPSGVGAPLDRRTMVRSTLWDAVGDLAYRAPIAVLPAVAFLVIDAPAAAVLFVAWQVAVPLVLAAHALATTWPAAGASAGIADDALLAVQARTAVRHFTVLAVPAAVALAVVGELVLRASGPVYAEDGTWLLRLLVVGAVPAGIVGVASGWYRTTGTMRHLAVLWLVTAGVLVGGAVLLGPALGLPGLGVAWVVSQAGAAGWVLRRLGGKKTAQRLALGLTI